MTSFDTAFSRIAEGAPLVMVLGGAGTGKTTFLHELRRRAGVRQVFLAPTGVAALQLGGQTIHSFFGIPPRILNPDEVKPRARSRKLLGKIGRLVIDEVSMVRCDLLDVVDCCLRIARNVPEPFGGVQVVLVGDFLQLPPVVPLAEQDMLARMDYAGPYAFDAKVLEGTPVARAAFTTVHRQTDRTFVEHLTRIRNGEEISEAIEAINIACCRPHRAERTAVVLAPTNAQVDAYNHDGLSALGTPERIYRGETKGEFDLANHRLPVPEFLAPARRRSSRGPSRPWRAKIPTDQQNPPVEKLKNELTEKMAKFAAMRPASSRVSRLVAERVLDVRVREGRLPPDEK